jgi:hypothetical protein
MSVGSQRCHDEASPKVKRIASMQRVGPGGRNGGRFVKLWWFCVAEQQN